jgi:hypothetical protein
VAVVEHVGGVVNELAVSPLVNPEYVEVMVGTVPPYVMDAEEAAMERGAGLTCTDPFT